MSVRAFNILRTSGWRWLLAAFGATASRSQVRVHPDSLDVEFGPFHERIPWSSVTSAEAVELAWWQWSLGWRTNLAGGVALLGAARNVVKVSLSATRRVRLFPGFRTSCRELFVSLEDPTAFLEAARERLGGGGAPAGA